MTHKSRSLTWSSARVGGGFTLLEVLAALAVLSIASLILITSFGTSVAVGSISRHQKVALALAQERMGHLSNHPSLYQWPQTGDLAEITMTGKELPEDSNGFAPAVLPSDKGANEREKAFYEGFSWHAFSRLPIEDAPYLEVTVVVRWKEYGRERMMALTSAVPRQAVRNVAEEKA